MFIPKFLPPVFAALVLAACGTSSMQTRLEQLEYERQDLESRNGELSAELSACKIRCESLERSLRDRKRRSPASGGQGLPDDLRSRGVNVKKNGHGETVIDIPSDVFFRSGASNLSADGKRALSRVADYIRKNHQGTRFRIEGHADTDPIRKTKGKYHCNWDLSMERAHAVLHHLIDREKFKPGSMALAGYGQYRPQDPGNKAKNRRVEIVIVQ